MIYDKSDGEKDSFGWTGHWWLPSNPDKKLPGVLDPHAERGPALELAGVLRDENDKECTSVPLVHGTTPKAEYVTLHKCTQSRASRGARGQYRTRYEVELAVTGEHFPSVESLSFQDLRIRYSTLVYWVCQPLVDEKALMRAKEPELVKVSPPIHRRIYQGDDFTLSLHYWACWEITGPGLTLEIYPGANIAIHWQTPRPLADTLHLVEQIRDFLAFATCLATHVEETEAHPVRHTRFGFPHDMLLFHRSLAGTRAGREPFLPLFSFKDVVSGLDATLSGWFRKGESLQPVIDLRLAPVYNPQMHPENQFQAGVQAVEAFHRRMRSNRELPEDAHAERMREILEAVPEQHRNWVKDRLNYSNEPSLRQRIKSLFDEFADILQHFDLDRKAFANWVYDTRNYLTHYDPKLESTAARGWDVQKLVYGMHLLLDICLLHEFALERDTIMRLVHKRHMVLGKS